MKSDFQQFYLTLNKMWMVEKWILPVLYRKISNIVEQSFKYLYLSFVLILHLCGQTKIIKSRLILLLRLAFSNFRPILITGK